MVPLRSNTIRLVQNRCSFHGLRSKDPIQYLKDFIRIVDSINPNGDTRNTTRLHLFHFSLYDQAINWLDRLPTGSISTWDDLTTRFLAQFFPPGRTSKLRNDILLFQQRQEESLYDVWTRFKELLLKFPHHGLDLWLQVQIFYDHVDYTTQMPIDYPTDERLRKLRLEVAWETIEDLARYEEEVWNDPVIQEEGSLNYENSNIKQLLGVMECKVDTLMKESISITGRSESMFGMTSSIMYHHPQNHHVKKNLKFPSLEVDLGEYRDPKPPIKPPNPDSFRMKEVDHLTIHTPHLPHVASFHPKDTYCYYHPCIDDPKIHYGFKPGVVVLVFDLQVIFDEKKLESSWEVSGGRLLEDDLTSYHMFLLHY
nr:zinc finger, CCHC-type [Tanacetum cinerariifolium]